MTIKELFHKHEGFRIHKWDHYLDIYDMYFSKYVDKPINFLEIGIAHGGSMEVWKQYFHKNSNFYGIDIIPECKQFEREDVKIFIGSQGSDSFLSSIKEKLPDLDILLDDGGHFVKDQIITFRQLWPKLKEGGLYVCEDLHTSYWYSFGGGFKRKNSFIEFAKILVDDIHAWHSKQPRKLRVTDLTKEIKAIHFYNSIVIIEKGKVLKPTETIRGTNQVPEPPSIKRSFLTKLLNKIDKTIKGFKD